MFVTSSTGMPFLSAISCGIRIRSSIERRSSAPPLRNALLSTRLIGPTAALEPVRAVRTACSFLIDGLAKRKRSCAGALSAYINVSSIAERIPRRGKRV